MDNKQCCEKIEKARADIMAAECTLWNIGAMPFEINIRRKLDRDLRISRAICALHDAENTLRSIEATGCSELPNSCDI